MANVDGFGVVKRKKKWRGKNNDTVQTKKRALEVDVERRDEGNLTSEEEIDVIVQKKLGYEDSAWAKFLVIEGENIQRIPYLRGTEELAHSVGEVTKVTRSANGSLVVEVPSEESSERLMMMTLLCGHAVRVTPHRRSFRRGVIVSRDLLHNSVQDILEVLRPVGLLTGQRQRMGWSALLSS
jgi:hypothetical protein